MQTTAFPRQKLLSTAVYDLPVGDGRQFLGPLSPLEDRLIGGGSLTAINLYHSGFWLTPYCPSGAYDSSGTKPSNRSVSRQRPDVVAGTGYKATGGERALGAHYNCFARAAFDPPPHGPGEERPYPQAARRAGVRRAMAGAAPARADESDVTALYAMFEPQMMAVLAGYAMVISGATEAVAEMRARGIKIAGTTGYTSLDEIEGRIAAGESQR